ncbi:MAG: lanthionine synthetase C family protein, partial [Acidobacteriota bacterium]
MFERGPWQPLLDGESAEAVWQAINGIAEDLRTPPEGTPLTDHPSLGGRCGRAIFFAYLAAAKADEAAAEHADDEFDQAVDAMASQPMQPNLYTGFSGIGWTSEHLDGLLFESDEDEEVSSNDLDEAILKLLELPDRIRDYDLIKGLVGLGVYALEALPRPGARRCLELLLNHLERLAESIDPGLTWHTPPELLPPHQREIYPEGYYNLGVAHGVPAVAALLGEMLAAGVATDRVTPLLEGAMDWILGQELASDARARFPNCIAAGSEPQASRLAWCYGDLGLAASLLLAARGAARSDWEEQAVRIASASAQRPPDTAGVVDAGLCHGSAGLAHLFNRIYQATGNELFASRARYWLDAALTARRPGEGFGGFPSWSSEDLTNPMEMSWIADDGFLTGA